MRYSVAVGRSADLKDFGLEEYSTSRTVDATVLPTITEYHAWVMSPGLVPPMRRRIGKLVCHDECAV